MVVDPGTAMLVASAVATAVKGIGDAVGNSAQKRAAKRRAKEAKRETYAGLVDEASNREAELEAHKYASRNKLAKSKTRASQETSDLVRGALNI